MRLFLDLYVRKHGVSDPSPDLHPRASHDTSNLSLHKFQALIPIYLELIGGSPGCGRTATGYRNPDIAFASGGKRIGRIPIRGIPGLVNHRREGAVVTADFDFIFVSTATAAIPVNCDFIQVVSST